MTIEDIKRGTLMGYSKQELVDHYLILANNNRVLRANFEVQYKNCMKIVDDMNLLNDEYKKSRGSQ